MSQERLRRVIEHPLHRQLGIDDIESSNGIGRFAIRVNHATANPAGVFHGGVLYLLCDVCAYAGLLSLLEPDTEAVTHDVHVSVMCPAARGDAVEFESCIARRGHNLCFIDVAVCANDTRIADARVTKSLIAV